MGWSDPSSARGTIVLASASPRRHALLRAAGVDFERAVAGVDEDLAGAPAPVPAAEELALRKARAVAERREAAGASCWIVGADTVVALGDDTEDLRGGRWSLLGKPADPAEARSMLERLSGSRHVVVTGVAVLRRGRDGDLECVGHEATWVSMRPLRPAEVRAYVASEEWRDKAGGYAIQETADAFVTGLEGGGFDNVVGLPVARTLCLLAAAGAPVPPPADL